MCMLLEHLSSTFASFELPLPSMRGQTPERYGKGIECNAAAVVMRDNTDHYQVNCLRYTFTFHSRFLAPFDLTNLPGCVRSMLPFPAA